MKSKTPRTDSFFFEHLCVTADEAGPPLGFARQLERDLSARDAELATMRNSINLQAYTAMLQRAERAEEELAQEKCRADLLETAHDDLKAILERTRAELARVKAEREEAVKYSVFIIRFDDTDREDELFAGHGAEEAAMKRWEQISVNWNAHLFRKIAGNADATDSHAIDAAIGRKP